MISKAYLSQNVARNYGTIEKEKYGYQVAVIDLRNPTKSDGFNMLSLISKYADLYQKDQINLRAKAKMEKYAKICAKTIIQARGSGDHGQNAYFYDSAEGVLAATIMLVAEFCSSEERHIVSVYKLIQELLVPSRTKGKNQSVPAVHAETAAGIQGPLDGGGGSEYWGAGNDECSLYCYEQAQCLFRYRA